MSSSAQNKLGTENINKILRRYAYPSIIAMTASSLYNVVDSIFIGHGVGALAISGLAVAFPFQNLAAAFGMLVGVGASALMSIRLGQHDYKSARLILGNVLLLNIIVGIVFTAVSLLFLEPILVFFGASEQTIGYSSDYMRVILIGNVITHIYMGLNSLLRSMGHPWRSMNFTICTIALNAVLNPIFLFVMDWGIAGVAFATVLSQLIVLVWQMRMFLKKDELIHFDWKNFHVRWDIVCDSLKIGTAPFLVNVASCFIIILLNWQLNIHGGDLAIGACGIVNRVVFIFLMIVMGMAQGMQPIVGYNYGAQQMDRVLEALKLTLIWGTVVTTIGLLVAESFPTTIARVFTTDSELIGLTVKGIRFTFMAFPLIATNIVSTSYFQSIGVPVKAIILSLTRQVIFLVPLLLIMPRYWGIDGVWLAMPIADVLSFLMSLAFLHSQRKTLKSISAS